MSKGCKVTGHQTLGMIQPRSTRPRAEWFEWGRGWTADFFLRPPTLTADDFEALWPKDFKFLALKDLNLFKIVFKFQKTSIILRVGFALSKWPHLHRAYVVIVPFILNSAVYKWNFFYHMMHFISLVNKLWYEIYSKE